MLFKRIKTDRYSLKNFVESSEYRIFALQSKEQVTK